MTHQIKAWNLLYKKKYFDKVLVPVRGLKMAKNMPKIADIGIFCLDLDDLHIFNLRQNLGQTLGKTSDKPEANLGQNLKQSLKQNLRQTWGKTSGKPQANLGQTLG